MEARLGTWRCATWNLDWWARLPEVEPKASLLSAVDAHVSLLQEVKGAVASSLRDAAAGPSVFSQEVYEPARWSWMGCAILLHAGAELLDVGVVRTLPKPQRSLWARVRLPDGPVLTAVSWHAPNAAGDGARTKMAAFRAMSDWLEGAPRPVVLGADLNTWRDPVDLLPPEPGDDFYAEHAFVGPDPPHRLRDGYRTVLERTGAMHELRRRGGDGPLATSHVLRSGAGHRMDRILYSPELEPVDGGYDLEAASRCGSDHAIHWIDFAR